MSLVIGSVWFSCSCFYNYNLITQVTVVGALLYR